MRCGSANTSPNFGCEGRRSDPPVDSARGQSPIDVPRGVSTRSHPACAMTLIYFVPQLIAGVAAGLVLRALNPGDK
jgi:hypothetical protein